MAERPFPELQMPAPVTRHLNRCIPLFNQASEPPGLLIRRLRAGMSRPNPPSTVTIFYLCLKNRPHAPCAPATERTV